MDLAQVSVGDLGYIHGARYADICTRGVAFGLELCPYEMAALALCLSHDADDNRWLHGKRPAEARLADVLRRINDHPASQLADLWNWKGRAAKLAA